MKTLKNTKDEMPKLRSRILVFIPNRKRWEIGFLWPQDSGSNRGPYFNLSDGVHYPKLDGDVFLDGFAEKTEH